MLMYYKWEYREGCINTNEYVHTDDIEKYIKYESDNVIKYNEKYGKNLINSYLVTTYNEAMDDERKELLLFHRFSYEDNYVYIPIVAFDMKMKNTRVINFWGFHIDTSAYIHLLYVKGEKCNYNYQYINRPKLWKYVLDFYKVSDLHDISNEKVYVKGDLIYLKDRYYMDRNTGLEMDVDVFKSVAEERNRYNKIRNSTDFKNIKDKGLNAYSCLV